MRASLANTASPSSSQSHLWYLVTWIDPAGKIWFVRAESDAGGPLTFHAGAPGSYDRPGIAYYTIPTFVDYRGGQAVTGSRSGNSITVHVPASVFGSPTTGTVLESVTGWTILDNGNPPFDTIKAGNIPTVVDATPAYDAALPTPVPTGVKPPGSGGNNGGNLATTGGPGAAFGVIALLITFGGFLVVRRRRRATG